MKVVILCGGQGTRIRDVADNIPKPMIPIGRYPILWHIMKTYAAAGHTDFVLCLGHQGQVIKDFFLNYEAFTGDFTISLGKNKSIEFQQDSGEENWCVTLADTGDSFTRAPKPDNNFGGKDFMRVRANGEKVSFAQFDASGLSGVVTSAILHITVQDVPTAGILNVSSVQASWDEGVITHNNKPALNPSPAR